MVQHSAIDHTGIAGVGGSVATDAIWDAAGDLVVGSGANTAAKLTIGAAGAQLARINGAVAWNAGTSFPTAATGDIYHRTDLEIPFWRYDGTRWRCTCLHEGVLKDTQTSNLADPNGNSTIGYYAVGTRNIYVIDLITSLFVNGTNNGTNYWTITLQKSTAGNVQTTIGSVNTSGDTTVNWTARTTSMNHVVDVGTYKQLQVIASDTLSPGNLFWAVRFTYNLIAT